jgi:hypothetical protein
MDLLLQRTAQTSYSTEGALYVDGNFQCYTLEPVVRERLGVPVSVWKSWGKAAIPVGTYRVDIAKFTGQHGETYDAPHLQQVFGFVGIYLHIGNYPQDTDGCILVGATLGNDEVGGSKVAFDSLMPQIQGALEAGELMMIRIAPLDATA